MIENPKVSIGLPVYNAETYLPLALDSILAQTYGDFELIISDNASTDGTRDICEARAVEDGRIRYSRNDRNIGASRNFNRTFELARAPYVKWAAADDLCEPTLVEKCLNAIEQDEDTVLAFPRAVPIDENGDRIEGLDLEGYLDLTSDDPRERFHVLMGMIRKCLTHVSGWPGLYLFGVIRSDVLRRTRLLGDYIGCDTMLLVELILQGKFREVPEYLLSLRRHTGSFSWPGAPNAERQAFFNPAGRKQTGMPAWRRYREFPASILHSPVSFGDKCRLLGYVAREAVVWRGALRDELVGTLKRKVQRKLSPG